MWFAGGNLVNCWRFTPVPVSANVPHPALRVGRDSVSNPSRNPFILGPLFGRAARPRPRAWGEGLKQKNDVRT